MTNVMITIKIMPESPETDLKEIEKKAKEKILKFTGENNPEDIKTEIKPLAFGLNSLELTFIADEAKGGTDPLEEDLKEIEGVSNAETTNVRRTYG